MRISIISAVSIYLFLCLFFSCKSEKTNNIKLAFITDSKERGAFEAGSLRNSVQIAIDQKNSTGGIGGKNIELLVIDESSDSNAIKGKLENIISKNAVYGIISATYSKNTKNIIIPVSEANKIALISPTSSMGKVTSDNDYIFRLLLSDPMQAAAMAKYSKANLKCQNTGIIYENNDYSASLANDFKLYFQKSGGKIVFNESFNKLNDKTIKDILTGNNFDSLYLPVDITNAVRIADISKKAGLNIKILGADSLYTEGLFNASKEVIPNIYFTNSAKIKELSQKYKDFSKELLQKTGDLPGWFDVNSYDAANILISSIESIYKETYDSDKKDFKLSREKIKDHIYRTEFEGLLGKISFYRSGDAIRNTGIYQIDSETKNFTQIDLIIFDKESSKYLELKN